MHFDGKHVLVRVGSQTDWEVPGDRPIQLAHHPAHPSGRKQTELLPQITYESCSKSMRLFLNCIIMFRIQNGLFDKKFLLPLVRWWGDRFAET